jgi:voltage-gated potassium channel
MMPGFLSRTVHAVAVVLIVLNVSALVLESVPWIRADYAPVFAMIEALSITYFLAEYILRVWSSVELPPYRHLAPAVARWAYVRHPLAVIDLLALFPLFLGSLIPVDLRAILILRLVRFFKLARYSPGMSSLVEAMYRERRALLACLVVLFGAVLTAASLMHLAEREAQPDKFGTIPDAMYWAMITLTTVGYGDLVPVTPAGKVLASVTAIAGLVMLALPVGIIASAFAREIQRRDFVVTWSMVARVPLFSTLDARAVAEIMQSLTARMVGPGEVICRRGEIAQSMYFIMSGSVEFDAKPNPVRLEEGQFFGEVSTLRLSRRPATVRALEATKLLTLDAHDLQVIMAAHPDIAERIEQAMASRAEGEFASEGGMPTTRHTALPQQMSDPARPPGPTS